MKDYALVNRSQCVQLFHISNALVCCKDPVIMMARVSSTHLFCGVQFLVWGEVLRKSQRPFSSRSDAHLCITWYSYTSLSPAPSWWDLCVPNTTRLVHDLPHGTPQSYAPHMTSHDFSSPYLYITWYTSFDVTWLTGYYSLYSILKIVFPHSALLVACCVECSLVHYVGNVSTCVWCGVGEVCGVGLGLMLVHGYSEKCTVLTYVKYVVIFADNL